MYQAYINERKTKVPELLSDKVDDRAKKIITKDREGHHIIQKEAIETTQRSQMYMFTIHQRGNIYEAKTDRIERKNRQIHNCTCRLQHIPLNNQHNIQTKKISETTEEPNNIINQQDLINNVYRTHPPTTAKYILFSSSCKTYTKMDYMLDYKIILNTFKRIDIIQCVLSP